MDTSGGDKNQRLLPGSTGKKYNNALPKKMFQKENYLDLPDRRIDANDPDLELCDNSISTSKYTLLNFPFKNLLEQFSKLANVYFLVIGLMQMIRDISVSDGRPVTLLPLSIIVLVSMAKDFTEDRKRVRSDNEENNKTTKLAKNGTLQTVRWRDLRVGDVIKIVNNEYFPCDVFVLGSVDPKGVAYIETKNLDGETNLKHKVVQKDIKKQLDTEDKIMRTNITLEYEKPNPYLYTFTGAATLNGNKYSCDNSNFILRGSSLRNTEWIYGLVCYTGHHTKVMLNSVNAKPKRSRLEVKMGNKILVIFFVLIGICIFSSIYYVVWMKSHDLHIDYLGTHEEFNIWNGLYVRAGNWLLIFSALVPISLLVTLEMVKVTQAIFMTSDPRMIQQSTQIHCTVQSSSLNEELGQIDYVFSDKTGTLTQNLMEFKKLSVNGKPYGLNRNADISDYPKVENVDFMDETFIESINNSGHEDHESAHNFLKCLAICHTVIVQKENGKIVYNASSPDEFALINFAKFMGYEYQGLDEDNNIVVHINGTVHKYKLLYVLEFNSARKRMSVIVEDEDGSIKIYCKGADSIIMKRIKNHDDKLNATLKDLELFANEGLRTLLLSERTIDANEFKSWSEKYNDAACSLVDRERKMEEVQEEIERDLVLTGATAIEDKLQDEVGETIEFLKNAGIKVWVLTGDKIETAINIAYSCKLMTNKYNQIIIDGTTLEVVDQAVEAAEDKIMPRRKNAAIITGDALIHAMTKSVSTKLMKVLEKCETVVCCRVSPKQKQEVVALVRREKPSMITLSIGDGANDVNMIVGAHVGIGIRGVEGQQAARASDYAIGEFKFLKNLLFVHGRECYRRNAHLILYNFYKNIVLVSPQFWYGFVNAFSGQALYDPLFYQLYNICLASFPIIVYCTFDKEYKEEQLLAKPSLYYASQQNLHFSNPKYWVWFAVGFYEAFIYFLVPYYIMEDGCLGNSGYIPSFYVDGNLVYLVLCIAVNLKIFVFCHQISYLLIITMFCSVASFFPLHAFFAWFLSEGLYGTFSMYWLTLDVLHVPVACILLTVMLHLVVVKFYELSSPKEKFIEEHVDETLSPSTKSSFSTDAKPSDRYKGFAFSQEDPADEATKKFMKN